MRGVVTFRVNCRKSWPQKWLHGWFFFLFFLWFGEPNSWSRTIGSFPTIFFVVLCKRTSGVDPRRALEELGGFFSMSSPWGMTNMGMCTPFLEMARARCRDRGGFYFMLRISSTSSIVSRKKNIACFFFSSFLFFSFLEKYHMYFFPFFLCWLRQIYF